MSNDNNDIAKRHKNELIAYLSLDFKKNHKIQNFKIWFNDDHFGAFHDMVIEVKDTNNLEFKYALHLKVGAQTENVSLDGLFGEKGIFSLAQYFESFKKIKNCIPGYKLVLWTNVKLEDKTEVTTITCDGKTFKVKIQKCKEPLPFLNISENCFEFKIESSSNSKKVGEYKKFLELFRLYTSQSDINKIKEIFPETSVLDNYLKFISNWSNQKDNKFKLNKKTMQKALTFCIPNLKIYPFVFDDSIDHKIELLQKAIGHSKVTIFDQKHLEDVRKIWGNRRNELEKMFSSEIKDILEQYQLVDNYNGNIKTLSEEVATKLLWITNKCPLILEENSSATKAIELCPEEKFVLIRKDGVKQNLEFLKNLNIFEKITKHFKCLVNNRKFELSNTLKMGVGIESMVTTDELISMAYNSLSLINQKEEKLPDSYIERSLTKNIFDLDILNNIDDGSFCVISNMDHDQEKYFRSFNLIPVEKTDNNQVITSLGKILLVKKDIYISRSKCSYQQVENLSKKSGKIVHHFVLEPDGKLQWITSIGGIFDLQCHSKNNYFTSEKNLCDNPPNKIQLIVDDPGSGKSVLLKSIKNHLTSKKLVVILTSEDIRNWCKKNQNFANFILEYKYSTYTNLEKEIVKLMIRKGEIFILWDDLDEISEENRHMIRKLILELSKTVAGQWITSRAQLGKILEEEFLLLSRKLQPFNPQQQKEFIKNRLKSTFSEKQIKSMINFIRRNILQLSNLDLLGVSSQVIIMTELFSKNPELIKKKSFSIIDLYEHFIEEQFNPYFIQLSVSGDTHCMQTHMKSFKNTRLRNYKEVALKTMFDDDFIEEHNAKCDDFFEEIKTRDYVGLITTVTGNEKRPYFIHNSYADYFVAKYLVENCDIRNIEHFIFQKKFRNVRFFFDLMSAENSMIHIATLCKNLEYLKLHQDQLQSKDKYGRNCLHLASSWGESYPILEVTKKGDIYIVNDDNFEDDIKEESSDYEEMFQFLLETCTTEEKDQVFEYAQKSGCLFPIIEIWKRKISNFEKNVKIICNILYYSTKFDTNDVLDTIDFSKYIETSSGKSLLHLAIENNRINLVEKLLLVERYTRGLEPSALQVACSRGYVEVTQMLLDAGIKFPLLHAAVSYGHKEIVKLFLPSDINKKNQDGFTPLHIACIKGHKDIVEMLVESGAEINTTSENGMTPLYIASYYGYEDIVDYLLAEKSQIDVVTKEGCTPLFAACARGHTETAKLLVASGADINKANL